MDTKTYTTLDRKALGWPAGPWDGEPDKVQWPDAATGLPCLAVRNGWSGNWCGYVGVSPGHPAHGKDYDDASLYSLEAHGGVTFAGACQPGDAEDTGICHVPAPGESDGVWWFGFDCAHAWDISPGLLKLYGDRAFVMAQDSTYRDLPYMQNQCAYLAAQLASMGEEAA